MVGGPRSGILREESLETTVASANLGECAPEGEAASGSMRSSSPSRMSSSKEVEGRESGDDQAKLGADDRLSGTFPISDGSDDMSTALDEYYANY
eukprot:CCRYP_011870-RB/>CCRYP_011870-RB protein AED:0.46 eAED:1.00 QI:0/0/0/1/0/0/2/0/94